MRYRLSVWIVALPVLMGLMGAAPQKSQETSSALPSNLMRLRTQYNLTPEAEKMLMQNGFLVLDQTHYRTLGDAYSKQHQTMPMYVTTDAMLELWSSINRELLKSTERQVCIPQLSTLLPALETKAQTLYEGAHEEKERKALRQVLVTLAVASRLLIETGHNPVYPPAIRSESDAQVAKVLAHREASDYPGEDYTQYTVRGYYADDPALSRYFRAAMWLSRQFFAVTPRAADKDPDASLRAAVACAAVVRSAGPETRGALTSLLKLRETLAGPPDAVSIPQLIAALDRSVSVNWRLDRALLPASLAALRRELAQPSYPVSQVRTRMVNPQRASFPLQTVAVLPGLAVPDSALFRQTVNPAIQDRSLPSGLEVGAALGSEAARVEITQQEGARSQAVLAAVDRYGPRLKADDGATIYSGWLHALSTLSIVPQGAPDFMRSPAWRVEKLNTTLASWAEIRHNFILYAEQNYGTRSGLGGAAEPALVEANPAFYQAMAQLAERTSKVLQTAGGVDPKSAEALAAYAAKCREFELYAGAELAGTLSPQQSGEINQFGSWLERSGVASKPAAMVADVATGQEKEVLHAATGDLRTILVIPDPKTGVVYTGAVLSYYEFTRQSLNRLTDAQWQAQQVQTYLRPEPPAWAYAFLMHEGGAEWQAREPLRSAEKLLVSNRTEEALALLRTTVAKNPDTTLATEAQLRLGRYYFDLEKFEPAEAELRRCERLPGCPAFDQAQEMLSRLRFAQERRDYQQNVLPSQRAEILAELKSLRNAVEALKRTAPDTDRERLLAQQLIHELPWEDGEIPWQPEVKALFRSALAAFRTQPSRDAIGFALLTAERGGRYRKGSRADNEHAIAFSRQAASPALRAAALSLALRDGYLADQPQAALALLRPFLDAQNLKNATDPALQLILTPTDLSILFGPSYSVSLRTNPKELFRTQSADTLLTLALASLNAGQIRQAVRYAQLSPEKTHGGSHGEEFGIADIIEIWGSLPDAELPAASALAVLHGLGAKTSSSVIANQALELARHYPHTRYAQTALCEAIWRAPRDESETQASKLKATLVQDYPESIPALAIEIEAAFHQGDLERTRVLSAAYQARVKEIHFASTQHPEQDPVGAENIAYRLSHYDQLVQKLKPLLDAANIPEAARMNLLESNGEPLAEALIKLLPNRAAEIYRTLIPLYPNPNPNPTLIMRFLERFPSDSGADDAWKRLVGNDRPFIPGALRNGTPETVQWLAPFVNRNDANAPAAAKLLKKMIGEGRGESGIRLAQEEARMVQGLYPESRACGVAALAAAETLLKGHRPEAMLAYADQAIALLPEADPMHGEAEQWKQRAILEIAAKHQQN